MITGQTMQTDARAVPVSTCEPGSLEDYETAIVQFQSYFGDPTETLGGTLKNDPGIRPGEQFAERACRAQTF